MSDTQHAGGVAWEAREALIAVRRAREAGDADAEDLGWLRYAEALTNASYSGAAAAFIDDRRQLNARVADLLRRIVAIEQRLNLASEAP